MLHRIGNLEFLAFIQLDPRKGSTGMTKVKSKICMQYRLGEVDPEMGYGIWLQFGKSGYHEESHTRS